MLNCYVYPFIAGTPSKAENSWLGFQTMDEAVVHVNRMNKYLENFGKDSIWDPNVWKTKPEPYVAKANPAFKAPEPVRATVAATPMGTT